MFIKSEIVSIPIEKKRGKIQNAKITENLTDKAIIQYYSDIHVVNLVSNSSWQLLKLENKRIRTAQTNFYKFLWTSGLKLFFFGSKDKMNSRRQVMGNNWSQDDLPFLFKHDSIKSLFSNKRISKDSSGQLVWV